MMGGVGGRRGWARPAVAALWGGATRWLGCGGLPFFPEEGLFLTHAGTLGFQGGAQQGQGEVGGGGDAGFVGAGGDFAVPI